MVFMTTNVNPYDHLNGYYRPGLSYPEQLLNTTVGRKDLLDEILRKLEKQIEDGTRRNFVFLGLPGVGKTHFISILCTTIQKSEKLSRLYTVIHFPEENHRILTFADLLLGIIEIMGHTSGDKQWQNLHLELERTKNDKKIIDKILGRIKSYHLRSGSKLLIVLENLDLFFTGQLNNDKSVNELKKLVKDSPHITFIGTSSHNLIRTEELKKSPYNLFETQILDVLTEKQTISLIRVNLEWNNRDELLIIFDDLIPRIKALYEMSGGNPRLSLILYELIVKENKWDVKRQIEKQLDQTSPFFRNRLNNLAPTEKAILETIALMRLELKTVTSISGKLRISVKQTSGFLNKLVRVGLLIVADHPTDKRSRIYRIKEGFFGLWLSIGYSHQQKIVLHRLVEFLEQWYAEKQGRERKRQQIWDLLRYQVSPDHHHEIPNQEQLLNYLSDIGSNEEKAQNKLELVHYYLLNNNTEEAGKLLTDIKELSFNRPIFFNWMLEQCENWISAKIEPVILQQIEDIIKCWKFQKNDDMEELVGLSLTLANSFIKTDRFRLCGSFIQDNLRFIENPEWRFLLLEKVAISLEKLNEWQNALEIWNQVLLAAEEANDLKAQGTILNNISQIYQDQGNFEPALMFLNRSLKILQEINDYDGQGTTLNNISTIHFCQSYYEKALECLEEALAITEKSRNRSIEGVTLSNVSLIYQARGDYKRALRYLGKSLRSTRQTNDKVAESTTLNNISQIYLEMGDFDESLKFVNEALSIMKAEKNGAGISLSLYNRGKIHWETGNSDQATHDWLVSFKLASEFKLMDILEKLNQLALTFGENGLNFWQNKLNEPGVTELKELRPII